MVEDSTPYSSSSADDADDDDNDTDRTRKSSTESDSDNAAATQKAKKKKRLYQYSLGTAARHVPQVERTDDNDDPSVAIHPVHRELPSAVWKTIDDNMKQVKVEKTAVHDFVANYLFPKLKFVRGSVVNIEYSTDTKSFCALVMTGCHQEHSVEGMIWWAIA